MEKAVKVLRVVVGVIFDEEGRLLIAKRPEGKEGGGLWEFPGGKVEPGESIPEALERELYEEVGIAPHQSEHLATITHRTADRQLKLYVRVVGPVTRLGTDAVTGCEGQKVQWVRPQELERYEFPEPNERIIKAIMHYLVPRARAHSVS